MTDVFSGTDAEASVAVDFTFNIEIKTSQAAQESAEVIKRYTATHSPSFSLSIFLTVSLLSLLSSLLLPPPPLSSLLLVPRPSLLIDIAGRE